MNDIVPPPAGHDFPDPYSGDESERPPASSVGAESGGSTVPKPNWLRSTWTFLQSPRMVLGPAAILLFGVFALATAREAFRDVVVIRSISAPSALGEQGYTSAILSQRLLDQIHLIDTINKANLNRFYLRQIKVFQTNYTGLGQMDIQLPGVGLSLRSALSYFRAILGQRETEVSGEIIQQNDSLLLRIRVSTQVGQFSDIAVQIPADSVASPFDISESNPIEGPSPLDRLLRNGAAEIVRILDPYALAIYYLDKERERAPEVIQYCEDHDPSCKRWAALLRGVLYRDDGNLDEAIGSFQSAIDEFRFHADAWPAYGIASAYRADLLLKKALHRHGQNGPVDHTEAFAANRSLFSLFKLHVRSASDSADMVSENAFDKFYIGHLYEIGFDGVPYIAPDCGQAVIWYRHAAAMGQALAQNSLGDLYAPNKQKNCDDIPKQDYEQAMDLYHQAAQQGQVYAQRSLGEIYQQGLGLDRPNSTLAIYWLRQAAEKGDAQALIDLGQIYWRMWAAENGDAQALIDLGQIYKGEKATGPAEQEEKLILAYAWFELASKAQAGPAILEKATQDKVKVVNRFLDSKRSQNILAAQKLSRNWSLGHRGDL